jgi:hypothetical protein
MTPQQIAAHALDDMREHEAEHNPTYWLGFLEATLEQIARAD